ncbi:glycerol-3-phosphate dehydrogenase [Candidatus Blochmanniella floridana]|uniref:Glycerol-3-phosphate dehydrogenase [NAD(P)+] n=1 Tax=Blochmanniella floridana TaxID=203907 RepID=GPDA_BLOFL|nr:RecName: Full=Glycerol-3-phosphate dehydrogenase [NAD(P)+]; AltName: Full=NAD(P)H-dependent glycerol-3-phosphate dehydrogenase [Candidatus Blochmannia floridanus]CAD83279.1 glycerol-3-phosphate dehydrogenase [Candidatus Blochmannia floridanus]
MEKFSVTVIGAGVYGTAIAVAIAKHGNMVLLWGHNSQHIKILKIDRSNQVDLPGVFFPDSLYVEESLSVAADFSQNILIAVPSHVFRCVLLKLRLNLKNNFRIIIASKGLEPKTGWLLQDVVYDVLGKEVPCAVISGPTFAHELAIGLPAAIELASADIKFRYDIEHLLYSVKNLRVYKTTDVIGVQIAGAVKNVIAIGVGISDGMGFGANARAALITRGLSEMIRLGKSIGAISVDVFVGLAGLGDLVLTCTDDQSRNRRFGMLLGQGMHVDYAQKSIGQLIEGISNTKEVYMLSVKYKVIMPITEQIYKILYENKNVHEAVYSLIRRSYIL